MGLIESKYSKFEKTLPDVTGKVFAITGTTSGTGNAAARTAAKHGGTVLLLNRPSERSKSSLDQLRAAVPGGNFVPIDCDLQDFASVRRACEEIQKKYPDGLYCLCNNAGILAVPDDLTVDGFDVQMQTNHLSHFLLTRELLPLLRKFNGENDAARIVQHSSLGRHMTANGKLEAPYLTKQDKGGNLGGHKENAEMMKGPQWERYFQTKLANSVFCHSLDTKLTVAGEKKILSLQGHPGFALTALFKNFEIPWYKIILMLPAVMLGSQSAEDGAMGILRAMMAPADTLESGTMYGPDGYSGDAIVNPAKPHETDPAAMELLWEKSETAIGAKFDI